VSSTSTPATAIGTLQRGGVKPGQAAPDLTVELVGGGTWRLADREPETFTMIAFYRGLHCPVCRAQLSELNRRLDKLTGRGLDVLAVSGDTLEHATRTQQEWKLDRLPLAYGLTEEDWRAWGLFVSAGIKDEEPERFTEPGMFLINPDGSVFYEAITSMPWGRPRLDDVLGGIDFVIANDYPARGEA
jgi:peroxiredoxin